MATIKTGEGEAQKPRGHLIVIEGLDRSGKTTQCEDLCEDIGGIDKEFKYIKFPGKNSSVAVEATDVESRPYHCNRSNDKFVSSRHIRAK